MALINFGKEMCIRDRVNSYKDLWKKGSVRPVGPEACNGKG